MDKPHIYRVTNNVNGTEYIGQHIGSKPHYYAGGKAINQAIKKYGKEAFTREIVVSGDFSREELDALEVHYIAHFQTFMPDYPDKGYNLTLGGGGKRGGIVSIATKKLISLNSANQRAVVKFDLQGNRLAEYRTILQASEDGNGLHSSIYRACDGTNRQANGYLWLFASDYANGQLPILRANGNMCTVAQYELSGEYVRSYNSITESAQGTGSSRSGIANVLAGLSFTAGGYQWKRVTDSPALFIAPYSSAPAIALRSLKQTIAVNMYSLDGIFIRCYASCQAAAAAIGVGVSSVRQCILGKYRKSGGYLFTYA